MKSEDHCFLAGKHDKPRQCVEKQTASKCLYSQGYGLPRNQVQLWELGCKEGKTQKNWGLPTVVLEKTPESPLNSPKEIKPVNIKWDQPCIFIGKTDAEAEAPVFRSSDSNRWLIGKVPDAGKDWGQKKRASEDEMAGWHHQCKHELGKTLRDGEVLETQSLRVGHNWWLNNDNKPYPSWNEMTFSDSYFPSADSFHLWPRSNLPNSQPIEPRLVLFFFFFICSEFCHTLKWNSHGFTCVPHHDPPSHLPLHPLPLGLPSAPGPSACLMHPTWAGDLFHPR